MNKVIPFGIVTHRNGSKSSFAILPDGEVVEHGTHWSPGVCFVSLMAKRGFTLLRHDESMDEIHIGLPHKEQVRRSHKFG